MAGIIPDRTHVAVIEDLWKRTLHDFPILQDIGNPGRAAQVVFEDVIPAILVSHKICSDDMAPYSSRWFKTHTRLAERLGGKNQIGRDDSILQDLLLAIDIVDKHIQRMNALTQTSIDRFPLISGHNPRDDVEWENLFRACLITINVEGNSRAEQSQFRSLLITPQFGVTHRCNPLVQQTRTRAGCAIRTEHLVVKTVRYVSVKKHKKSVQEPLLSDALVQYVIVLSRLEINSCVSSREQ